MQILLFAPQLSAGLFSSLYAFRAPNSAEVALYPAPINLFIFCLPPASSQPFGRGFRGLPRAPRPVPQGMAAVSHGRLCSRSSPRGGGAALRNAAEDNSRQSCARRPAGTAQSPGGGAGPSGGFAAAQRLTRPPATPITAGGGRGGVGVEPSRRCPSRISGGRVHGCDSPGRVLIGCPAVTDRPPSPRRRGTVVRRAEAARGPLCAGTDCAARSTAGTRGWGGVCGAPRSLHGAVTSRSPAARPRTLAGRFPAHRPVTSLRTCPPRPLQRDAVPVGGAGTEWAWPTARGRCA